MGKKPPTTLYSYSNEDGDDENLEGEIDGYEGGPARVEYVECMNCSGAGGWEVFRGNENVGWRLEWVVCSRCRGRGQVALPKKKGKK